MFVLGMFSYYHLSKRFKTIQHILHSIVTVYSWLYFQFFSTLTSWKYIYVHAYFNAHVSFISDLRTLKFFKNPRAIISRWGWFCSELFLKVKWPRRGVNNEAVVSGWRRVVGKGGAQGSQRLHAIWMGSTPGPANDYIQTRVSPRLTVIVMACAQSYNPSQDKR